MTVNKPYGEAPVSVDPVSKLPHVDLAVPAPDGTRQALLALGPEGFARALREQKAVAVTDTTFRDAHQSLLATRVRTRDLTAVAGHVARMTPQLWALEAWGGATYDVALRFLSEDPWERLAALRQAVPNICLQMLLRGRNTVGYTPYPTEVTEAFVHEAAETGIDVFRIFDALNDVEQMRPAIEAVRATGTTVAEVALCYTGDLSEPGREALHARLLPAPRRADRRRRRARARDQGHGRAAAGAGGTHAGARAAGAVRPARAPAHPRHPRRPARDAARRDRRRAWTRWTPRPPRCPAPRRQPALSALVATTDHTARATGLDLDAVCDLEPYWEATRRVYAPFESGLPSPTGRVYTHEIPGGQLSNLRQQAISLGLGEKFEQIEDMYAAANRILGNIVKVTPSSKVVGDLALHLVAVGADPAEFEAEPGRFDVPDSVIGFLSGELGDPPGGWPEPFRTKALAGRTVQAASWPSSTRSSARACARDRRGTLNRLLFPGPSKEFAESRQKYGDLSVLPTRQYLYGLAAGEEHQVELAEGKRLIFGLQAVSEPDERGIRTVMCTINGQLRPVNVRDRSVAADVADRREGRHLQARSRRGAVRRRGHDRGRRGRHRRGRRDRGHDRGDEDGGLHHGAGRRHRRPAVVQRHPAGRGRRPGPRPPLTRALITVHPGCIYRSPGP